MWYNIKKLKSTKNLICVVHFSFIARYNKTIKIKEANAMNTDKIYAEQLANEYAPKGTSKVVALKKLDAKAKRPATIFSYTLGIISTLLFGVGMCLAMGQIGKSMPYSFVIGIIIGVIGLIGAGINFPIYKKFLAKGKQKYAFEIMQLAKEIIDK